MNKYISTTITIIILMAFFISLNTVNYQTGWYDLSVRKFFIYLLQAVVVIGLVAFMDKTKTK